MRMLLLLLGLCAQPLRASDCVILLHGLARTQASMQAMESALLAQGYAVSNPGYRSREASIAVLAEEAMATGLDQCTAHSPERIHLVTHSLGGILVRQYLHDHPQTEIARVVMLGPPNQGSQIVDHLRDSPGFGWLNGPAGLQLGTAERSVPKSLGPVAFELGVIAGTFSVNPILSTHLPEPNDGKVSVAATRVSGMADHLSLPTSHTFMMRNPEVIAQTLHFLRYGQFDRVADSDAGDE